jgi:cobalt-zinc-cadmium efflux system outer membrane protein
MGRLARAWRRCRPLLCSGGLLLVGCVSTDAQPEVVLPPVLEVPAAAPASAASPGAAQAPALGDQLTLGRLLEMAVRNHPELGAAQARALAARGRLVQAGLYPHPQVNYLGDEIGNRENAAGFEGAQITQNIVTAHKIPLAKAAAARGVEAADWQALTVWHAVRTRVRLAYYEVLTAGRGVEVSRTLLDVAQQGLDAAEKLLKGGTGTQPDVLRARVARDQAQVAVEVARRRLEAATRLLANAVGLPELPASPEPGKEGPAKPVIIGKLEKPAPVYDWEPLRASVLDRSSEVQEARAMVLQAEKLLERARADVCPDIFMLVRPTYFLFQRTTVAQVQLGATLPLFNRNQGNILAAEAEVARTRAEVGRIELTLVERLAGSYQRYQAARRQVSSFQEQVLPAAEESLRLIQLGYERGDPKYDYTALLQALQTLAAAQLSLVQALGEQWRAVSEILGLLQVDGPEEGGKVH